VVNILFEREGEEEILPLGGGCALRSSLCGGERTRFDVFNELVLPSLKTAMELSVEPDRGTGRQRYLPRLDTTTEQVIAQAVEDTKPWYEPRVFAAILRYENVRFDQDISVDLDGDVYSTLVHVRWESDDFSYGILLPYEFLDLDGFDAHRIGFILYGQYRRMLVDPFFLGVTLHGNYSFTNIDDKRFDDLNTWGTGVALSLEVEQEAFQAGLAVLYNYAKDDSDHLNDEQHLLSIGAKVGLRTEERVALLAFVMWNYDLSEDDPAVRRTDDDYIDVGFEASWSLTPSWKLTGGYKKVLALKDFNSDLVFIGTLLRF
jgi:hypothetical protein